MFTGLIQEIGEITAVKRRGQGLSVQCDVRSLASQLKIGDSLAINGVCSTIETRSKSLITVFYSPETLSCTTCSHLKPGQSVNLEPSLKPSDALGGHFVQGHVDTVGQITTWQPNDQNTLLEIKFDSSYAHLLIPKGSIAIDGISLTIATLTAATFQVAVIGHTQAHTTLKHLRVGDEVNLEFDMLGKYLYRFYKVQNASENDQKILTALRKAGRIDE